jgi:alkylation response protein AidB-like acyl-CoA dehydrogenase
MDMAFSAEDEAFRGKVRAFLSEALPKDVSDKVINGRHIPREDIMAWHHALHKQGWITPNWPTKKVPWPAHHVRFCSALQCAAPC